MELLVDGRGRRVASESEDVYPMPVERQRISVRTSRVNHVLGTELDAEEVWDALAALGIELDDGGDGDTLVATVPTFRPDLEREIDLVEEVARRIGFDHIGRTVPKATGQVGGLTALQRDRRAVADALGRRWRLRSDHPVAGVARRPRAGRRAGRSPRARLEPAPRRGVGAAHPCAARTAAGGRIQPLPRSARRRALRTGPRLPRPPPTARGRFRRNPSISRWRWRARCAAGRSKTTARSTCTTRSMRCAPSSTRSRSKISRSSRRTSPASVPGAALGCVVGGADVGVVGEIADQVVDALGLERPVVAFEVVLDSLVAAPRGAIVSSTPCRASRRRRSTLPSWSSDTVPADAIARTLREAGRRPPRGRAPVRRVPVGRAR